MNTKKLIFSLASFFLVNTLYTAQSNNDIEQTLATIEQEGNAELKATKLLSLCEALPTTLSDGRLNHLITVFMSLDQTLSDATLKGRLEEAIDGVLSKKAGTHVGKIIRESEHDQEHNNRMQTLLKQLKNLLMVQPLNFLWRSVRSAGSFMYDFLPLKQQVNEIINYRRPAQQLPAQQLPVATSTEHITVQPQGPDASCGYHAVKNGVAIAKALMTGDRTHLQKANDQQFINDKFGPNGTWRHLVVDLLQQGRARIAADTTVGSIDMPELYDALSGDWLNHDQVKLLLQVAVLEEIFNQQLTYANHIPAGIANFVDTLFHDVTSESTPSLYINVFSTRYDLASNKAWFNTLRAQDQFVAIVAMGTGSQDVSQERMHWFTVVIHKPSKERIEYFVADSAGNDAPRTDDPGVQAIKNMFLETKVSEN